ncbi:hypothetical protein T492DRAFT_934015 [Pavlovales sp. CCMP2436]|nr:hypothetical protein T492DRAFT_934015 [Pavlovales sp. CCMP2436]
MVVSAPALTAGTAWFAATLGGSTYTNTAFLRASGSATDLTLSRIAGSVLLGTLLQLKELGWAELLRTVQPHWRQFVLPACCLFLANICNSIALDRCGITLTYVTKAAAPVATIVLCLFGLGRLPAQTLLGLTGRGAILSSGLSGTQSLILMGLIITSTSLAYWALSACTTALFGTTCIQNWILGKQASQGNLKKRETCVFRFPLAGRRVPPPANPGTRALSPTKPRLPSASSVPAKTKTGKLWSGPARSARLRLVGRTPSIPLIPLGAMRVLAGIAFYAEYSNLLKLSGLVDSVTLSVLDTIRRSAVVYWGHVLFGGPRLRTINIAGVGTALLGAALYAVLAASL